MTIYVNLFSLFLIQSIRSCDFHHNCEITMNSRKVCAACRFAKCLGIGMSPDFIRKEMLSRNQCKQKQLTAIQSFVSILQFCFLS